MPLGAARAASAGRARVRAEWGVGDDEVVIGAVANYRPQKGYPDLLSAARTVIDEGLPVRFVAIGQGPLEGEIKRRHAELALGDRFRLLGYHPNPFAVLAGCDVFVMASLYEGYSVALMEALAMALPVVATSVGGVPDAIGDGKEGLIVPPGRPELLARALLELVGDAERRKQMASAAWARAARYDIGVAVRRIESAYRDVCNA